MEVIKSTKGKQVVVYEGFTFVFERDGSNKKIWHCTESYSNKCKGRCHTIGSEVTWHSKNHNHLSNPGNIQEKLSTS